MSCCLRATMCDPASGEQILITGNGTEPANHYIAKSLVEWQGDPDTLVPCDGNSPIQIDTGGQAFNPTMITVPVVKGAEAIVENGVTGCEIWRLLADVSGNPQWHQIG